LKALLWARALKRNRGALKPTRQFSAFCAISP